MAVQEHGDLKFSRILAGHQPTGKCSQVARMAGLATPALLDQQNFIIGQQPAATHEIAEITNRAAQFDLFFAHATASPDRGPPLVAVTVW